MAFVKGERFDIDLGSDGERSAPPSTRTNPPNPAFDFLGEIKERTTSTAKPPTAPTFKSAASGFPEHKKRTRTSAFKQQRKPEQTPQPKKPHTQATDGSTRTPSTSGDASKSWEENEREQIDLENQQKLADMSPDEIERERQELFSALNPSLIEKLLRRANIDDEDQWQTGDSSLSALQEEQETRPAKSKSPKKVTFQDTSQEPAKPLEEPAQTSKLETHVEPPPDPSIADKALLEKTLPPSGSIHFPRPPAAPELDPNSPSFLDDLHTKYFPDLAHDAAKISWMTDASNDNTSSSYHPSRQGYEPSEVRFNFRGQLIPPRLAQEIPVTEGLHHHGDAPEAAGYTILELARLARSAVPAQRCIAIQTVGRVLYRLGIGEFGVETDRGDAEARTGRYMADEGYEDDEKVAAAELARGLWSCVEEGRVIETLEEEASKQKGHLTSITLAKEALWNWQKGGGRKRRAV